MSLHIIDSLLLFFFFIATFEMLWKTPFIKGMIGERNVKKLLNKHLDKNEYHSINDVIVPTDNGTTQIDHIVISKFGVFVIETKNINRWIFGDEKSPFWTQVIFRKKTQFQNPLRQNYKHIKTLENVLEISEATLYSIVTLTGSYHFKGELPAKVVDIKKLIPYIKCRDTVLLKADEKERVTKKILYYKSQTTLKKSLQHIANVRNRENKNYKKNLSVYELFYEIILKNRVFLKLVILFLSTLSIYILLNTSGLNLHQNTYSSKIIPIDAINKKIIPQKNNTKEIHPAQPTKFPGAIYSWKNEKGIRVYSNIGFPKNGKYTEGKIEWQ